MSLPKALRPTRRFLLCLPLALAACGFQPVYGPGGTGTALQNRVLVDAPSDENGYLLTREIEERLGRAASPAYGLALTTTTGSEALAIDAEGNINRYNLVGSTKYALRDISTGEIVTSGEVQNFTGYSTTGTVVATLAAQQDAQKRLMTILAEQIVTRLHATALPR